MTQHTFTMSEEQAKRVFAVIESQCGALKNWTCTAVEQGDMIRANSHVEELRAYQAIFAAFNMPAKHAFADVTGKALVTSHTVAESVR